LDQDEGAGKMHVFVTLLMYVLWIATIVFLLVATFNNFQYEDLNLLAVVFLFFSLFNSFFVIFQNRKK